MARIRIEDLDGRNLQLSEEEMNRVQGGFSHFTLFGGPIIGTLIGNAIGDAANDPEDDTARRSSSFGFGVSTPPGPATKL